jgi:hypothetical protein
MKKISPVLSLAHPSFISCVCLASNPAPYQMRQPQPPHSQPGGNHIICEHDRRRRRGSQLQNGKKFIPEEGLRKLGGRLFA